MIFLANFVLRNYFYLTVDKYLLFYFITYNLLKSVSKFEIVNIL